MRALGVGIPSTGSLSQRQTSVLVPGERRGRRLQEERTATVWLCSAGAASAHQPAGCKFVPGLGDKLRHIHIVPF